MKLMTVCATSVLLLVSLTSCRQEPATVDSDLATRAAKANNIIYLHTMVTRAQDPEKIFNDIVGSGNVVVDFYADWCSPCKAMGRVIDQVASQFSTITFLKVDTDQFKTVGRDVQSIPTLVFYKNGKQLTRFSGAKDKNTFITLLNKWYQENK